MSSIKWWDQALALGHIYKVRLQSHLNRDGSVDIWPESGWKMGKGDTFVQESGERNYARIYWEKANGGQRLVVNPPTGKTYAFFSPEKLPGRGTVGGRMSSDELLFKDPENWPSGALCALTGSHQGEMFELALQELVYRLKFGATYCFENPMKEIQPPAPPPAPPVVAEAPKIEAPKPPSPPPPPPPVPPPAPAPKQPKAPPPKKPMAPAPKKPAVKKPTPKKPAAPQRPVLKPPTPKKPAPQKVAKAPKLVAKPKPQVKAPPPLPKIDPEVIFKLCEHEFPQEATTLWNKSKPVTFKELRSFVGVRCGYNTIHQTHSPAQSLRFNDDGDRLFLQVNTKEGNKEVPYILMEMDKKRLQGWHMDPWARIIPPHMGGPGGNWGTAEVRALNPNTLLIYFKIPSDDGKDYFYAYSIVKRGRIV